MSLSPLSFLCLLVQNTSTGFFYSTWTLSCLGVTLHELLHKFMLQFKVWGIIFSGHIGPSRILIPGWSPKWVRSTTKGTTATRSLVLLQAIDHFISSWQRFSSLRRRYLESTCNRLNLPLPAGIERTRILPRGRLPCVTLIHPRIRPSAVLDIIWPCWISLSSPCTRQFTVLSVPYSLFVILTCLFSFNGVLSYLFLFLSTIPLLLFLLSSTAHSFYYLNIILSLQKLHNFFR